jgi:hypothetical protein
VPEELNWKGQALFHTVRWVLPAMGTLLLLLLFWVGPRAPWVLPAWRRWGWAAWLLSRPVYALVLYLLLDYRGSGDFAYWVRWAREAQEGGMPGRDFGLGYGPFYTWLHVGGLTLFPHASGVGILLPILLGDLVAVMATAALARQCVSETFGAWMGLAMVASPLLWHEAVVGAQDEPLFAGFLAAGWLLLQRDRFRTAGVLLAIGYLSTKITFAVYVAFLLAPCWGRPRALLGAMATFVGTLACVYVPLAGQGLPIVPFGAVGSQGGVLGVGIPSLIAMATGVEPGPVVIGLSVVLLGAVGAWTLFRPAAGGALERCISGVTGGHAAFMALMPGCLAVYGVQGIPFVTWFLGADGTATRRRLFGTGYAVTVMLTMAGWAYGYAYFPWWVPAAFVAFHLVLAGSALGRSPAGQGEPRPGVDPENS